MRGNSKPTLLATPRAVVIVCETTDLACVGTGTSVVTNALIEWVHAARSAVGFGRLGCHCLPMGAGTHGPIGRGTSAARRDGAVIRMQPAPLIESTRIPTERARTFRREGAKARPCRGTPAYPRARCAPVLPLPTLALHGDLGVLQPNTLSCNRINFRQPCAYSNRW